MWRATVVEQISPGRVSVKIPKLYPKGIVKDIQASFDAQVGQRVIVADLHPDARVHDWWVVGRESELGIWGNPYPHEHPIGQITGLSETLAGYATTTALSNGLSGKVNSATFTAELAKKVTAPGPWVNCTPSSYISKLSGGDIQARTTPDGIDIRSGRWRYAADVPRDSVIFTLPAGMVPPVQTMFMTSGMSAAVNDYAAITVHLETRSDGTVTARSAHATSPTITLSHRLMF